MSQEFEHLKNRIVLGFIENVEIVSELKPNKTLQARIDTGAQKSSIDQALAKELDLGPVIKEKIIKQSTGSEMRPIIKVTTIIHGKEISGLFTIADRSNMKYPILIGQNLLKKGGFLIDPQKQ